MEALKPAIEAPIEIAPLGDCGLLVRWPQRIDAALNRVVQRLAISLRKLPIPGVVDVVPSYASLALLADPLWLAQQADGISAIRTALWARLEDLDVQAAYEPRQVTIPVCYGGDFGPDLDEVAAYTGLSAAEVVARHVEAQYQVALLGFQPGFPYLLGLDAKLAVPRKATPRLRVPAGAVAIGGAQTGIYPRESPGGWLIIGRTPVVLFDEKAVTPALLEPGDRVLFHRVSAAEFAMLRSSQ